MSILVHEFSRRFQLLNTAPPLASLFCKKKMAGSCEYPMKPMERHQPNSASFSIAGGGWGPRASVDHHVYTLTTRPVYIYTHTHTYVSFVCVCVCVLLQCLFVPCQEFIYLFAEARLLQFCLGPAPRSSPIEVFYF